MNFNPNDSALLSCFSQPSPGLSTDCSVLPIYANTKQDIPPYSPPLLPFLHHHLCFSVLCCVLTFDPVVQETDAVPPTAPIIPVIPISPIPAKTPVTSSPTSQVSFFFLFICFYLFIFFLLHPPIRLLFRCSKRSRPDSDLPALATGLNALQRWRNPTGETWKSKFKLEDVIAFMLQRCIFLSIKCHA